MTACVHIHTPSIAFTLSNRAHSACTTRLLRKHVPREASMYITGGTVKLRSRTMASRCLMCSPLPTKRWLVVSPHQRYMLAGGLQNVENIQTFRHSPCVRPATCMRYSSCLTTRTRLF